MFLNKLLRHSLHRKLLITPKYFVSQTYVSELMDESYDTRVIDKIMKIHENIKKETNENLIQFSEKAAEPLFPPLKAIVDGFSAKFQKMLVSEDPEVKEVSQILLDSIYNKNLRYIYQHFDYNRKMVYPRAIFAFRDFLYKHQDFSKQQQSHSNQKLIQLAACFEYITMGHFLHNQIEAMEELKLKFPITIGPIKKIEKYFNDGKILLAGDFFHTKASKIGSEIGLVEVPYFLSIIEESLAKAIIREQEIVNKIDKISMKNLIHISYHETSLILSLALKATCLILSGDYEKYNEDITNFAMNFGSAWHFVSNFKEQYEIWLKLKQYKPYAMLSFLQEEQERLKMRSPEDTLKYLAESYIMHSEKNLKNIINDDGIAKSLIQELMKITEINQIELLPKLKI